LAVWAIVAFGMGTVRGQTPASKGDAAAQAAAPVAPPQAQTPVAKDDAPLPDIPALMRDVEAHQRQFESVEKNYLYHRVDTEHQADSHGQTKKTLVHEFDVYWVNGVRVNRLVKKDGRELTASELAEENERIDKAAAKARERRDKADAEGKETDSRGNQEVTVSRILELGAFSNARRVQLAGRDTIAVDYTGDPKAKTHNRSEEVIRDIQGTVWIDERDHVLVRAEGHFANAFKVGGGLLVDIQKDTRFSMEQTKVNGEVWLPARLSGQGAARIMLFFSFNGNGQIAYSDYRKFKATSTILPGMVEHPDQPVPDAGKSDVPQP
jgi:hypothetical protein